MDSLAIAGGLGIDLGQLVIALHQGYVGQVGVAGQGEQQGCATDTTAHDQHIGGVVGAGRIGKGGGGAFQR